MSLVTPTIRESREEIAQREIGHTEISARLAWAMTVVFLLTLSVPPTVQLCHELGHSMNGSIPSSLALFRELPDVAHVFQRAEGSLWNRTLTANRQLLRSIEVYERQLEERSLLTQQLLGPTQHVLTCLAGLGNEKAYVGRDGWLFYRPDVDYITGPGFLVPAVLHKRSLSGKQHLAPPEPDPRPAIVEFHQHLARRGIQLIVMPIPGKSAIHPERLSSRFHNHSSPLENASFARLRKELEAAGVLVFDPSSILMERRRSNDDAPQFLRTDTHWTAEAMQFVAEQLGTFLETRKLLPPKSAVNYRERSRVVEHLGDIALMLRLPKDQALFPPEKVTLREVLEPDGRAWKPDAAADVLLLGDSYTNIYSLPEMHWGSGAGLAEQLSFVLRRPIDRMAQNDGGAHAVRQALHQELIRGPDRLAGKRVVIWEFAVRELAFGDWKRFPMPDRSGEARPTPGKTDFGEVLIHGTVRAAAGAPQPGSVPYRDAVTGMHLDGVEGLEGTFPNSEIVVYVWGLRENQLTAAAKFALDQKVTLKITPWETVRANYERFNRIELDDPDFRLTELPTYWAEIVP